MKIYFKIKIEKIKLSPLFPANYSQNLLYDNTFGEQYA